MSQQAQDTFGNETPREHGQGCNQGLDHSREDTVVPIEQATQGTRGHTPIEGMDQTLRELHTVATQATGESALDVPTSETTSEATNAQMSAALREAAREAHIRDLRARRKHLAPLSSDSTVHELEGQGFTEDEALRLIAITGRLEDSAEAREAAATLHRLRFTRWLVEHGKLDEWSA